MKGLRTRIRSRRILASSDVSRKGTRLIFKTYPNLKLFSFKDRSKLANIIS